MRNEGTSRQKNKTRSSTYIPGGSLQALAKQQRVLLTQRKLIPVVPSNEEQQLVAPQHPRVGAHVQTESITSETQAVEEQIQLDSTTPPTTNEQCEEQGISAQKRKRGKTKMERVHGRHERKLIVLNELNQPVGPSKADVTELSSFLGTLARNASLCPLDIRDWRKMDTKEHMWEYTKRKYDIPDAARKWVFEAIKAAWRSHKSRLKKDHFYAFENDEIRMVKKPEGIPASQFKELLHYWNSDEAKKMSKTNAENRKNLKNPHTVGHTSFALVINELEKNKKTSEPLSAKEIFVATRTRKPGRTYKESYEDTASKIAEMDKVESHQSEDDTASVNAFASVMGPEHPGRLRLYGRGVTKTSLQGKVRNFEPSLNVSNDLAKSMEERMQRMEENFELSKKRMEEDFELSKKRMEEKFDEEKLSMRQEVAGDIIAQLQRSGYQIDPNILATLCGRSPGEASSAPLGLIQPFHRPSAGSNQGEVNEQLMDDESNEDIDLT